MAIGSDSGVGPNLPRGAPGKGGKMAFRAVRLGGAPKMGALRGWLADHRARTGGGRAPRAPGIAPNPFRAASRTVRRAIGPARLAGRSY